MNVKDFIIKIKRKSPDGKEVIAEYLPTFARYLWFREEHPDWKIIPTITFFPQDPSIVPSAVWVRVEIKDEKGEIRSIGDSFCKEDWFKRFVEKAVTNALGIALARLGYSTPDALSEDEDFSDVETLADTPIEKKDEKITEAQENLILGLAKSKNIRENELTKLLGKPIKELTKSEASVVIDKLKSYGGQ